MRSASASPRRATGSRRPCRVAAVPWSRGFRSSVKSSPRPWTRRPPRRRRPWPGHSNKLSETLTGHLNAFEDAIVVRGGSLAEKIAADAAVFTDIVSTKLGSIETLLTTHGDGLVGRLNNHAREATQAMEGQITTFEQRASARTGEIVSSLDGLIGRIDGTLEKHAGVFTEGLKARTIEVARAIAESGRSASAQLEIGADRCGKGDRREDYLPLRASRRDQQAPRRALLRARQRARRRRDALPERGGQPARIPVDRPAHAYRGHPCAAG